MERTEKTPENGLADTESQADESTSKVAKPAYATEALPESFGIELRAARGRFDEQYRQQTAVGYDLAQSPEPQEIGSVSLEAVEQAIQQIRAVFHAEANANLAEHDAVRIAIQAIPLVRAWERVSRAKLDELAEARSRAEERYEALVQRAAGLETRTIFRRLGSGHKQEQAETARQIQATAAAIQKLEQRTQALAAVLSGFTRELPRWEERLEVLRKQQFAEVFLTVRDASIKLAQELVPAELKERTNEALLRKLLTQKQFRSIQEVPEQIREEILHLLREQMREGVLPGWDESSDLRQQKEARQERYQKLAQSVKEHHSDAYFQLEHVRSRFGIYNELPADRYYDELSSLVARTIGRQAIERLASELGAVANTLEIRAAIKRAAADAIGKDLPFGTRNISQLDSLDLETMPIKSLLAPTEVGFCRWGELRSSLVAAGAVSSEIFNAIEDQLIQRLVRDALDPGGYESWDGTHAVNIIAELGSPRAIPHLIRHIERHGGGHTSVAALVVLGKLYGNTEHPEYSSSLEAMPRWQRNLLALTQRPNSGYRRFSGMHGQYMQAHWLQQGQMTLAKEALLELLEQSQTHPEDVLREFYNGTPDDARFLETFAQQRDMTEQIIIASKVDAWNLAAPKLLARLSNPAEGYPAGHFGLRIVRDGLKIAEQPTLEKVQDIFRTKRMLRSGYERLALTRGLIFLNTRPEGASILGALTERYRGSRTDPQRFRRILEMLQSLDVLGAPTSLPDLEVEVSAAEANLQSLTAKLEGATDKAERSRLRDAVAQGKMELENLKGLKGIEDRLTDTMVETVARVLALPPDVRVALRENIDDILQAGVLEVVIELRAAYERKNLPSVAKLLAEITEHVVKGDFQDWRYTHEQSQAQLSHLSEAQYQTWVRTIEPVQLAPTQTDEEMAKSHEQLQAARRIIDQAKAHVLTQLPELDWSEEQVAELSRRSREAVEMLKVITDDKDRQGLIHQRQMWEAQKTIIGHVRRLEQATPEAVTGAEVFAWADELASAARQLNLTLAEVDFRELGKVMRLGEITHLTASETDSPTQLLKVGTEPQETCQSWRGGGFNECLLAYVADGNKKVVNVTDQGERIIARSIVKLTKERGVQPAPTQGAPDEEATLFVETPYTLYGNPAVYQALYRLIFAKARAMNVGVAMLEGAAQAELLRDEAERAGYVGVTENREIWVPQSRNTYEYSDALGGKLEPHNAYIARRVLKFSPITSGETQPPRAPGAWDLGDFNNVV